MYSENYPFIIVEVNIKMMSCEIYIWNSPTLKLLNGLSAIEIIAFFLFFSVAHARKYALIWHMYGLL